MITLYIWYRFSDDIFFRFYKTKQIQDFSEFIIYNRQVILNLLLFSWTWFFVQTDPFLNTIDIFERLDHTERGFQLVCTFKQRLTGWHVACTYTTCTHVSQLDTPSVYNFVPCIVTAFSLAFCRNAFLSILPDIVLGISVTNSTPPRSFMWGATRSK